jgi:hypothetical protein
MNKMKVQNVKSNQPKNSGLECHPFANRVSLAPDANQYAVYAPAIARHLPVTSLGYGIQDSRKGIDYSFEFYVPTEERAIKIFTEVNEAEIDKYAHHPDAHRIEFIYDVTKAGIMYDETGEPTQESLEKITAPLPVGLNTYLLIGNELWKREENKRWLGEWERVPQPAYIVGWNDGYDIALDEYGIEDEDDE